MIEFFRRLKKVVYDLHDEYEGAAWRLNRRTAEAMELMMRYERICKILETQQQQVRILHDDMAKMIQAMQGLQRDHAVTHQDVGVIAGYLTEHAKKIKILEKPEG